MGRKGSIKQLSESSMELNIKNKILIDGKRISSTLIRNLLANDKLDEANKYIGRPYSISGKVVHGKKRGGERLVFLLQISICGIIVLH